MMTTITLKQGVSKKSLKLINIDAKQGGWEREALLHPNGSLDRVGEASVVLILPITVSYNFMVVINEILEILISLSL